MIRKSKGEYVCECTDCGAEQYGGTLEDFREFVDELKAGGWLVVKEGDEWCHYCPDCLQEG